MSEQFQMMRQASLVDAELKGRLFRGYAAVFDTPWNEDLTASMGYVEKVAKGAFRKALGRTADVPLLLGHDRNQMIATTKSGNLRVKEEPKGLLAEAKLPDNALGEYARTMIEAGDIQGMSYGISLNPRKDVMQSSTAGVITRTIVNAQRLLDVSLTWEPAYTATTVELRSQGFVAIPAQEAGEGEETQLTERGVGDPSPDEETAWQVDLPAEASNQPFVPWWELLAQSLEQEM